ncbi:MAG: hypothetical protein RIQ44_334, partial [Actinomycetota bacterium]
MSKNLLETRVNPDRMGVTFAGAKGSI